MLPHTFEPGVHSGTRDTSSSDPDPLVTIVIVTWNAAKDIKECLSSIMNQSYSNIRVLVVDSASTDDTVKIVRAEFPSVQLVASHENLGYRRGNRLGMQMAEGDYVVVCNDDVSVKPDWLVEMVRAMEEDPNLGMVTPRIVMYNQPHLMNAAGNTLHYSGISGPRAKLAPVSQYRESTDVAAVSGCCFMIRSELLRATGGFSQDFEAVPQYWHASAEDVDLGWHVQMLGYRLGYVASSVMHHKFEQISPDNLERFSQRGYGYPLLILRNFDASAIALLLPIILLIEFSWFLYAVTKGRAWVKAKLRAWKWFVTHRRDWIRMRASLQPLRKRSYWHLLPRMSKTIDLAPTVSGSFGRAASTIMNLIFWVYYQVLALVARLA